MRFTVVGPGAVGSLIAARLTRSGGHVCLLDYRPERAEELEHTGITVEGDGPVWSAYPAVSCDPTVAATGADCIIICVKAFHTTTVCRRLAPYLSERTVLLSLQNGLGNIEQLMALGAGNILAGVTGMGVRLMAPGQVLCTGSGITWIAAARGENAAAPVVVAMQRAGFDARLHPDLRSMLWTKLIINAAINPLTARYRLANGELLSHPEAAPQARAIVTEAVTVARAAGIPISEAEMLMTLEEVCRRTALNRSSMLCDVEQGRPLELQSITGAIIRQADALGIAVPVNRRIMEEGIS